MCEPFRATLSRNSYIRRAVGSGLIFLAIAGTPAAWADDDQAKPLTPAEVAIATRLARDALPELQLPLASRPRNSAFSSQPSSLKNVVPTNSGKLADPDVGLLGAPGVEETDAHRRAVVTQFDYATGLLATVVVDLQTQKVLDVSVSRDKPATLSTGELQHALDLAIAANSDLRLLASEYGRDHLGVEILMPVNGKRSSPLYGHRVVLLWVETPRPSERVLVDLTTDQVSAGD